jgi:hypothetical protein
VPRNGILKTFGNYEAWKRWKRSTDWKHDALTFDEWTNAFQATSVTKPSQFSSATRRGDKFLASQLSSLRLTRESQSSTRPQKNAPFSLSKLREKPQTKTTHSENHHQNEWLLQNEWFELKLNYLPGVGIYAEPNMYIRSHSMYQMRVKLTILTQNNGIFLPLFQMGWV